MLENIPAELREYRQFVVWNRVTRSDREKPAKIPYSPITGQPANVNDPTTWGNFDDAVKVVSSNSHMYAGIGFVLTDNDPFTFIDLDVAQGEQPTTDQELIFKEFDSYTEYSPSGNGVHIIVKGKVPTGRRRGTVEVYSSLRYMTMTGNVIRKSPIMQRNELINTLWAEMSGAKPESIFIESAPQTEEDSEIIKSAKSAKNCEKFIDLFECGNWQKDYSDQSIADQALMNIIAFYTNNKEQAKRIFLASKLGQRDKAKRYDYMNATIEKAFDQKLQPVDFSGLRNQLPKPKDMQPNAGRYRPLLAADFSTLPPMEWRIKNLVPASGLYCAYGPSGSGKSFLMTDMAAAIAEGCPWFGHRVKPSQVLYVGLEGEAGYRGRVMAWQHHHGRSIPPALAFVLQPFHLTNAQDVIDLAATCPPGCVVMVDTMNRAAPSADENSSRDMGLIIEGAKTLQRLINGLVILIAHTGKDAAKGLRGHSSLFAALDGAILVNRNGDTRSWKLDKSKDGKDGAEYSFRLNVVEIGFDEDGDAITSCVIESHGDSLPTWGKDKPLTQNQKLALDTFIEASESFGALDENGKFAGLHLFRWKPLFYSKCPADNDGAKSKAFQRSRKDLIELGRLSVVNNIYRIEGPQAVITEAGIAQVLKNNQADIRT